MKNDQRPSERTQLSGYELCDAHGSYTGTFVTEIERWQVGDVRWNVEAVQPLSS